MSPCLFQDTLDIIPPANQNQRRMSQMVARQISQFSQPLHKESQF
jgi:hypothetical protein